MFYPLRRLLSRFVDTPRSPSNVDAGDAQPYPATSPAAAAAASRLNDRPRPINALAGDAGDVMDRILAAIEEVRPAIRMDGGDIEVVRFDGESGTVVIRLKGACRSCPMSEMTLQLGVERVLRELVPEVQRIEAV